MIKKQNYLWSLLFGSLFVISWGCNKERNSTIIPNATGRFGEVMIVMDTVYRDGPIGKSIKNTFALNQPGLPQSEPMFDLSFFSPKAFLKTRKTHRLICMFGIESDKSETSAFVKKEIFKARKKQNDQNLFWLISKDLFAKGQCIIFIYSEDSLNLINNLNTTGSDIRNYIYNKEIESRITQLKIVETQKNYLHNIQSEHNFSMMIPNDFQLVMNAKQFLWWRKLEGIRDHNIFVTYKTYQSTSQLHEDSIKAWRAQIGKSYIFGGDSTDSYMTRQMMYDFITQPVTLQGQDAIEIRSVWKLQNNTMGGPFVAYQIVNQKLKRIYYIEGFLFCPDGKKRNHLRELVSMLRTFTCEVESNI